MDIVSLPIEFDEDKIDSRFRLVTIASQRAKELAYGAKPKMETRFAKAPTVAIEEALEHVLEFVTGDEAKEKLEEAKKFDYKRFLEERRKETMPEDLSELEKDLRLYLTEREDTDRQALEDLFSQKNEDAEEQPEE
jgi:DNA-directed RNA polymerase subunit omega